MLIINRKTISYISFFAAILFSNTLKINITPQKAIFVKHKIIGMQFSIILSFEKMFELFKKYV